MIEIAKTAAVLLARSIISRWSVHPLMGAETQQLALPGRLRRVLDRASHSRNGYRERECDTRAGSISLAMQERFPESAMLSAGAPGGARLRHLFPSAAG